MDLITQGLLGSTVAQITHGKKLGRTAAIFGGIIGLMPDADVFLGILGRWSSLNLHRTFTHSIFVEALAAIPIGLICRKFAKSEESKLSWMLLAFGALVTHPLLDLFTSYGTEILWPISYKRYSLDGLAIIDLVYSLPLIVATYVGICTKASNKKLHRIAVVAMILSCIYNLCGFANSRVIAKKAKECFATQGFNATEVRAMPTNFNILLYRVVLKDKNGNFIWTHMTAGTKVPVIEGQMSSDNNKFTEMALNDKYGKVFLKFSQGMLCPKTRVEDDKTIVTLNDMRYALVSSSNKLMFKAEAIFDKSNQLVSFNIVRNESRPDVAAEISQIYQRIID